MPLSSRLFKKMCFFSSFTILLCNLYALSLFLSLSLSPPHTAPSVAFSLARSLAPSLLLTTCLAHSSSARWNNTPSHTKASSADSLKGPAPTLLQQLSVEHMTKREGVAPESRSRNEMASISSLGWRKMRTSCAAGG